MLFKARAPTGRAWGCLSFFWGGGGKWLGFSCWFRLKTTKRGTLKRRQAHMGVAFLGELCLLLCRETAR